MCQTQEMTFPGYTDEALNFLENLKSNNSRDWFAANKLVYEKQVRDPTKILAAELADRLEELTEDAQKSKIFRIHRDLRFSKDKTPYNTHVHISLAPQSGNAPAFMLGWSHNYLTLGCGVFEFQKDVLANYRTFAASGSGEKLQVILDKLIADGGRIDEPVLKRVPSGFDPNHPRVGLLRRKGIAVWQDLDDPKIATQPRLVDKVLAGFETFLPLYKLIRTL